MRLLEIVFKGSARLRALIIGVLSNHLDAFQVKYHTRIDDIQPDASERDPLCSTRAYFTQNVRRTAIKNSVSGYTEYSCTYERTEMDIRKKSFQMDKYCHEISESPSHA